MIFGDNAQGISELKLYLEQKFRTNDLGQLRYLLGIEVERSNKGIFLPMEVCDTYAC